ncbi:unnamed protein product, partial [Polarella glacialis]
ALGSVCAKAVSDIAEEQLFAANRWEDLRISPQPGADLLDRLQEEVRDLRRGFEADNSHNNSNNNDSSNNNSNHNNNNSNNHNSNNNNSNKNSNNSNNFSTNNNDSNNNNNNTNNSNSKHSNNNNNSNSNNNSTTNDNNNNSSSTNDKTSELSCGARPGGAASEASEELVGPDPKAVQSAKRRDADPKVPADDGGTGGCQ